MMRQSAPDTWCLELVVRAESVAAYETALEEEADAMLCFEIEDGPDQGRWRLQGVCRIPPDMGRVATRLALTALATGTEPPFVTLTHLPARDWVSQTLEGFPPLSVGRFFVHGSHITKLAPSGQKSLMVDAGVAFGTGEHASTSGCLLALDRLARRRRFVRVLDMGCGSGILSLAVARVGAASVLAADLDPVAVHVTTDNARKNGLQSRIRAVVSDGFGAKIIRRSAPFDLIFANILARPLVRLAPAMARAADSGGNVILSGLLIRQQRQVLSAFRMQGFRLESRIVVGTWITLVLKR